MKIGISSIGYQSKELLEKCFSSWAAIKNNPQLCPDIENVKIIFSHGCFEETFKLGFPIYSDDGTIELAKQFKENGIIDSFHIYDTPQIETYMWTNNAMALKEYDIDLMIMVNVDEIWEVEEIKKLMKYIKFNNFIDYFKINFKNYCIDYNSWVDDFIVPRIWMAKKYGGIKRHYLDEWIEYEDNTKDIQHASLIVPKGLIFPKHYSWVGSKTYLQRKLHFQALRFGVCSYIWDDENDCLKLNESYYRKYNRPIPVINHD